MRPLLIAAAVVLALLVGGLVFFAVRAGRAASAAQAQNEQLLIDMAQRDLEREYGQLNDEFATFENQRQLVLDDSVKRELNDSTRPRACRSSVCSRNSATASAAAHPR